MRVTLVVSIVFLLAGAVLLSAPMHDSVLGENSASHSIACSDIPRTVKLVGRFGVSLGEEVLTIRGRWKETPDEKPYENTATKCNFHFVVSSINGKTIQKEIQVPWDCIEPLMTRGQFLVNTASERKWKANLGAGEVERLPEAFDGDEWEMVGFEEGKSAGWPRAIDHMYRHLQHASRPGRFLNTFRFATVRIFGKSHDESEVGGYRLGHEDFRMDDEKDSDSPADTAPTQGSGMF